MPIPLPTTPADALSRVIRPGLDLLPSKMGTREAEQMVLSVMLQESGLATRQQYNGGPARGLAMFERNGVRGVMGHPATKDLARKLCGARGCPATEYSVYLALAGDDLLATGFARLLLWTDPEPLPRLGERDEAWHLYQRCWRPGKPRPEHWPAHYAAALAAVTAADTEPA